LKNDRFFTHLFNFSKQKFTNKNFQNFQNFQQKNGVVKISIVFVFGLCIYSSRHCGLDPQSSQFIANAGQARNDGKNIIQSTIPKLNIIPQSAKEFCKLCLFLIPNIQKIFHYVAKLCVAKSKIKILI